MIASNKLLISCSLYSNYRPLSSNTHAKEDLFRRHTGMYKYITSHLQQRP